ncbi:MAG TPA: RNA polymerase sigma factor [Thermoanaerobaculia bacterium]|nr:RNA polymerase sigma factor [Thermoanaerobaculia bacterium]
MPPIDEVRTAIERIYRDDSRRVFATLVRLLGDFDAAEEAMHEAFAAAVEQWPADGIPANPVPWLISAGRFRAIDTMRRMARFDHSPEVLRAALAPEWNVEQIDEKEFRDDQLRLIFTCCHPALPPATRVAMTLREICGLTTEEVASALLQAPPTIAQRIVRGKAKIRDERIPYRVPSRHELPERLDSVLSVLYLVFNEGYSASSGSAAVRHELTATAIHLTRTLALLLSDPEVIGLLALMLLHDSRRSARTDAAGDLILIDEQDRSLWNRAAIAEGTALARRALAAPEVGRYTLQAAIAALHATASSSADTDWAGIVRFYDLLMQVAPSPVTELNRAVAVAMLDTPEAGLLQVDAILERGELHDYHLAHAARADLCRRLGRLEEARASYERALGLAGQEPERRFLERRLRELEKDSGSGVDSAAARSTTG